MRKPLSVEKQVAITMYYLANEGRYRKEVNAFGISRSTVSVIVSIEFGISVLSSQG